MDRFKIILPASCLAALLVYLGYFATTQEEVTPCSPQGYPGRCYEVKENTCKLVWDSTEVTCRERIRELALPPGRLEGPILNKCRQVYFDKTFSENRKSDFDCELIFREFESWSKRNSFK